MVLRIWVSGTSLNPPEAAGVVAEEGWPFAGVGAQFAYELQQACFDDLDAPILRVTGADVPMPYNKGLEKLAKVDAAKIVAAAKQVCYQA